MAENFFYWLFTLALMAGFWFVYVPVVIGLLMPVRWFQGNGVHGAGLASAVWMSA